ncbi:uncharacterized protein METZ01_LOCUS176768, partial [marine metagenome]
MLQYRHRDGGTAQILDSPEQRFAT